MKYFSYFISSLLVLVAINVNPVHADTVYDGSGQSTPAGQILTGSGTPPIYVYGFQYYNGSTTGSISNVVFQLNAKNGNPNDLVYGTVWDYSSGVMKQIATSTNHFTGASYDGNLAHPNASNFEFNPPLSLKANGTYFVAIRAVMASTSQSSSGGSPTQFVLYGNSDPNLVPSPEFSSCTKNSGVELKITGALSYIDSRGTVGWKSCGYLVGASVMGQSSPLGVILPAEGYGRSQVVGQARSANGGYGQAYNTHTGGVSNVSSGGVSPSSDNPNSSGYRLVTCDGPEGSRSLYPGGVVDDGNGQSHQFVACDFGGLVNQVQHIINALIVFGVFIALIGFLYTGYLFITGKEDDRKRGYSIFPKIFWGFIIMLSAWFIVHQIMNWLASNASGFTSLLK
ncbi:MAG: hypothetical protein WCG07_01845 [Candidatus Taylorbacteria bacterium]